MLYLFHSFILRRGTLDFLINRNVIYTNILYGKLWEAKKRLMGKQWLTVDPRACKWNESSCFKIKKKELERLEKSKHMIGFSLRTKIPHQSWNNWSQLGMLPLNRTKEFLPYMSTKLQLGQTQGQWYVSTHFKPIRPKYMIVWWCSNQLSLCACVSMHVIQQKCALNLTSSAMYLKTFRKTATLKRWHNCSSDIPFSLILARGQLY